MLNQLAVENSHVTSRPVSFPLHAILVKSTSPTTENWRTKTVYLQPERQHEQ